MNRGAWQAIKHHQIVYTLKGLYLKRLQVLWVKLQDLILGIKYRTCKKKNVSLAPTRSCTIQSLDKVISQQGHCLAQISKDQLGVRFLRGSQPLCGTNIPPPKSTFTTKAALECKLQCTLHRVAVGAHTLPLGCTVSGAEDVYNKNTHAPQLPILTLLCNFLIRKNSNKEKQKYYTMNIHLATTQIQHY